MKQLIIGIAVSLCCTASGFAQSAKTVFIEALGPGIFSFNYDMRVSKKQDGLGFRVGVGTLLGTTTRDSVKTQRRITTYPIGLNYLFGKGGGRYFETGAGYTFVHFKGNGSQFSRGRYSGSAGYLHFGYRSEPVDGGLTFRTGITPIIGEKGIYPIHASVSVGYKF